MGVKQSSSEKLQSNICFKNEVPICQCTFAYIHLYFIFNSFLYILMFPSSTLVYLFFAFSFISFAWRSSFSTVYIHMLLDPLTPQNYLLNLTILFFIKKWWVLAVSLWLSSSILILFYYSFSYFLRWILYFSFLKEEKY